MAKTKKKRIAVKKKSKILKTPKKQKQKRGVNVITAIKNLKKKKKRETRPVEKRGKLKKKEKKAFNKIFGGFKRLETVNQKKGKKEFKIFGGFKRLETVNQKKEKKEEKKVEKAKERDLEKIKKEAFRTLKKKRGWFAEREEHALVAKGVEVRKKELTRYRVAYLVFIFISFVLAILSIIKENFFSFAIAILLMFVTVICYRTTVIKERRRYIIYIVTWPFTVTLAIASIFKRNFLSFSLAILAIFLSSLTPNLINKKARKDDITKTIRELQKSRKETETDFDKLFVLLQQFKKLKISEIAEAFGIDRKKAYEWATIMEESNLANIHYPPFGEEELSKKEK